MYTYFHVFHPGLLMYGEHIRGYYNLSISEMLRFPLPQTDEAHNFPRCGIFHRPSIEGAASPFTVSQGCWVSSSWRSWTVTWCHSNGAASKNPGDSETRNCAEVILLLGAEKTKLILLLQEEISSASTLYISWVRTMYSYIPPNLSGNNSVYSEMF